MPQYFKYNTGSTITNTTQKGNIAIASSGIYSWGPTSSTGFYVGINAPTGGYSIYYMRSTGGPSVHVATSDAQAIRFLKSFGATGTTISDVLTWASGQSDYYVQTGAAASNLVTDGLVFNLQTAPSSGTSWTDSSGNGYNATLQGTPTYVSNNGGGIRLNNANSTGTDYISVPYNINSSTVTVEMVASFNPTSFWGTIWGNDIYNSNSGYFAYQSSATNITWGKPQIPTTNIITASNSIRHWAFVINGSNHLLYLNGTQVGTTASIAAQTLFATSQLYFGARHVNNGIGPADKLNNSNSANYPVFYQMRVYSKALSGAEITQNYNDIKSTYGL